MGRQAIDLDQLRTMIAAGLTLKQMAMMTGASESGISRAISRENLREYAPPDQPGSRTAKALTEAAAKRPPASADWMNGPGTGPAPEPKKVNGNPVKGQTAFTPSDPAGRWNSVRDFEIIRTKGKYAKLTGLAEKYELPIQVVMQRWHALRVHG
ncbi:MAG: hypothetical protein LC676_10960 [Loktanella sp.]|nr:hypothetical protein [Loktanella sp.]